MVCHTPQLGCSSVYPFAALRNRSHYKALRHSDGRMPRLHPEYLTAEVLDLAGLSHASLSPGPSSVSPHRSIKSLNVVSATRAGDQLNLGHEGALW